MSLLRLYSINEAGVKNKPTGKLRKRYDWPSGGKRPLHTEPTDEPDDDEDDLGPELDYDDPTPEEPDDEPEPVRPAKPFKEPEREVPVFGKSMPPSPALQGGKTAGSISADRETLGALERALENVRTGDDDLQDWIDDLLSEIGRAIRTGGELKLPKFVAAQDDGDEEEDEDY